MAIYHCSTKPLGRSGGRSAVAAAAYRSAERLENARDGLTHDYRSRNGVEHAEIVLPAGVEATWARDRSALWNAAERAERRADARTAREWTVALPHELTPARRIELTRAFAQALADRHGCAVDVAIHAPHRAGDVRNHHAHLLTTTREITAEGFGAKTVMERKDRDLLAAGLPTGRMQVSDVRALWEQTANEHLGSAGFEQRIDHRSHADRGLELEPTEHQGVHATGIERKGGQIERGRLDARAAHRNAALIREKPEQVLTLITGERSVFDRHDIARALHRAINADPREFQNAFTRVLTSPELVRLQDEQRDERGRVVEAERFTTRRMIDLERGMAEGVDRLAATAEHGVDRRQVEAALASHPGLAHEQRAAVEHITGREGIAAVVGRAGAGKSTMLGAAREAWEAAGYRVHGAALAGKAAEGLEQSSGVHARTLASWERAWERGTDRLGRGDVLVVDEAGMVSSEQMARVVQAVERDGVKLVLVGDPEQLQPIQAGAAFRAIAERTGFVELEGIRRQRESWQREASLTLGRQDTARGLAAYEQRGAIRFEATREDARAAAAADYLRDRTARPEGSWIALAHTRADVQALNAGIRAGLKEWGELRDEAPFEARVGTRTFAAGDRVVFLENSRELGVKNGTLGTVLEAREGRITARLDEGGRAVTIAAIGYDAVDHGYATTIHKAQGITVDRAFVVGSGSMDRHMTYVALTRHRDGVQLYAGQEEFRDFAALSSRLSRGGVKETTLDYARRRGLEAEGREPARDGARTTAERPLQRPAAAVERGSGPEGRETPVQEPAALSRSWLGRLVARVRGAEPARPEAVELERLPGSQPACEPTWESPIRIEERNRLLGRPGPTAERPAAERSFDRDALLGRSKPGAGREASQAEATRPGPELDRTPEQRDRLLGRGPRPSRPGWAREGLERDQDRGR